MLFSPSLAGASTFDVNVVHDSGSGVCDAEECTLREAINAANEEPDQDLITFSVAGTISPNFGLPFIRNPVTIDGFTAPGAAAGAPTVNVNGSNMTNAFGLAMRDAVTVKGLRFTAWGYPIQVGEGPSSRAVIQGNVFGGVAPADRNGWGILVDGDDTLIGGPNPEDRNVIQGTSSYHLEIRGADRTLIQGNYIGTAGTVGDPPRGSGGVYLYQGAKDTMIGGNGPGEGNLISGSTGTGIVLYEQSGTKIRGNLIGTTPDGLSALPNNSGGVIVYGPTNGVEISGNKIAFNGQHGVQVRGNATSGVNISGTSIHSNQEPNLNISPFGLNINDPGDTDTGPNELQNHPELIDVAFDQAETDIEGVLDSVVGSTYRIEFFANAACGSEGHGPGEYPLGSVSVTVEGGPTRFEAELGALPAGKQVITATATSPSGSTSEFSPCRIAHEAQEPPAPDFTVTSLAGTGAGSLREAIIEANETDGHDVVTFEVAGTIAPYDPLPPITDPVTIDGSTAPGSTAEDPSVTIAGYRIHSATGLDLRAPSTIRNLVMWSFVEGTAIRIGPEAAGTTVETSEFGWGMPDERGLPNGIGIDVLAEDATLGGIGRGNTITSSVGPGILLQAPGAKVIGNRVGLGRPGDFAWPNSTGIRILEDADRAVISDNHVSANEGPGLHASGASGLLIEGNRFGGNQAGAAMPNLVGVLLEGTRDAELGANLLTRNEGPGATLVDVDGLDSSQDRFQLNGGEGVRVLGSSTGVDFSGSSFQSNADLGIDLAGDGVTANDPGDADTGPNQRQNFPVLEDATFDSQQTEIKGSLESVPELTYLIRIHASNSCDPSGYGEGEVEVGTVTVTTDESGNANFSKTIGRLPAGRNVLTATAVSPSGSGSEFSRCLSATPAPPSYEVKSLGDEGDGVCDSTCTLRDAILTANGSPQPKTISFSVAGVIAPASVLPALQAPVTLDGASAPGAVPGSPSIEISGTEIPVGSGLTATAPAAIRTLKLTGFAGGTAIRFESGSAGSTLQGSLIGDASSNVTQNQRGVSVNADDVGIGGLANGEGNQISGSQIDNLLLAGGSGITVQGNEIGAGKIVPSIARSEAGIRATGPLNGSLIGGSQAGAGNVISGTAGWGVRLENASGLEMKGNLVGIGPDRITPLPNARGGILLDNASGILSSRDTIAFNGGPGIRVEGASLANDFGEASIHSNAGLGIDLNADGVSANDPGDADAGPNGMQNFPLLTTAEAIEEGIRISAEVDLPAPGGLAIDFYASASCDPSGNGEGARFLGTLAEHFPAAGKSTATVDLPFPVTTLRQITATATGNDGTSEFSACRTATGFDPPVIVEPPPRVKAIPVNGRTVVVAPVNGRATVTKPGGRTEVIREDTEIPVGSTINPGSGTVLLSSATAGDRAVQSARFWAGSFRVTQKRGQTLTGIDLVGGRKAASVCRGGGLHTVRKLWGRGKGRFKTKGNRASAGVRGTHWLTADRCDGTLVRVREGVVEVRDFGRKKTVILRTGGSYIAKNPTNRAGRARSLSIPASLNWSRGHLGVP